MANDPNLIIDYGPSNPRRVFNAGGPAGGPLAGSPLIASILNPLAGFAYSDHFGPYIADAWAVTNVSSAVAQNNDLAGGNITITPGNSADASGSQLQGNGMLIAPPSGAGQRIGGVVNFKADLGEKLDLFFGITLTDTTIMASGLITPNRYVGALIEAGAPEILAAYKPTAALSTEKVDTATTIDDDTWVELGWSLSGDGQFSIYKDGVTIQTLPVDLMPDIPLRLSFAAHNANTAGAPNVVTLDSIAAAGPIPHR